MNANPKKLLTSLEAAPILAVSQRRVRQLTAEGVLRPAIETPWGRLYTREEVERLAAERAGRQR